MHDISVKKYVKRFGKQSIGKVFQVGQLAHSDLRYIEWKRSLLKRPPPWNIGKTKEMNRSVAKISATFKRENIDNFKGWREIAKKRGLIPSSYPVLEKNKNLAFLIGIVLGDGHLEKFPRTELLQITLGTDKPFLWKYVAKVVQEVFGKAPRIRIRKTSACLDIRFYQKYLAERLQIPIGDRRVVTIKLPQWVWGSTEFLIPCLRGLFEAEGSFSVHEKTYTYNLSFSNRNQSLLNEVEKAVISLGFHPERRSDSVRLRRKREIYEFVNLILFRKYSKI